MSDTRGNVRPSSVWLLPAAVLALSACYAEFPGTAPIDDSPGSLFPDGGSGGFGGTLAGGGLGGDGDGGPIDTLDGGTNGDSGLVTGCDGVAIGVVQMRKLYAEAQVVPPATCKSEMQTRTCRNTGWSTWSGTFKSETCVTAAVRSCGDVAHGATESRDRYPSATVSDYEECVAEEQTRECDDGTFGAWTGSATFESCEVSFLGHCSVISDVACVSGSSCTFKLTGSLCLGSTGHSCSANTECASGTCVNGSCVAAKVPTTGACDEAADCAACTGTVTTAVCTASNVCACSTGANCTNNNQCQGSCVANKCVAANTTCDNEDDCASTSKCSKSGPAATGTCVGKDGQSCSTNTQCEHVCRPSENNELFLAAQKVCAGKGTGMAGMEAHCDENADCNAPYVCRPWPGQPLGANVGTHCQATGASTESCDETADCAQAPLVPAACISNVCVPSLISDGGSCISPVQCTSGVCNIPMGQVSGTCGI
jgi:hypothetical protein